MTRTIQLLAASAIFCLPATAYAQAAGGGPAVGSTDAAKVTRDGNTVREDYNRIAGSKDAKPKKARKLTAVPATADDVLPGKTVTTLKGELLGTVEMVQADGAVVRTGTGKVKIPLEGFGRTEEGLVLAISKAEFDAAVASAVAATPQG